MNGITSSRIVRSELDSTGMLALRFVWFWLMVKDGDANGAEIKRRWAKFDGMCYAANALGYGSTENHVSMVVREVMHKRSLPAFKAAGDQTERDTWEFECVTELRAELQKIWS